MTGVAEPGRGLDPAEDLLDALAGPRAGGIVRVAGGARVDGRAPVGRALGDVRRDVVQARTGMFLPRIRGS